MATADKQIPRPADLDLEFFQAATREGTLHVQRCSQCLDHHHPPRLHCPVCFSGLQSFVPVPGTGTVYSHTLSHFTAERAWKDQVPYATIVVELDEGPRLVGSAQGLEPADIVIGLPVRVVIEPFNDDFAYLWVERLEERA